MEFILDNNASDILLNKKVLDLTFLGMPSAGMPICYDKDCKKITNLLGGEHIIPLGITLNSIKIDNNYYVNVLYKGFLLKDILSFSQNVKTYNIQNYIIGQFKYYKNALFLKMPKIKRLKRLNLKLLTLKQAHILYDNFEKIIEGYTKIFGEDYANNLKAQIVTTPIYIQEGKNILLYYFDNNLASIPEFDGGNFLCYFTYKYN